MTLMIFVMSRFQTVLPKIMADELIYSLNTLERPLSEATHPNYLYYWLFSPVAACGDNFYGCTKWMNMIFLLGIVGMTYLISRKFAKPGLSLTVALITMVGPISTYVSFFTPDLMFFFSVIAIVYWLLNLSTGSPSWHWVLVGVSLGLAALVKPHALFIYPAVLLYATWLHWSHRDAKWWRGAILGGVTVLTGLATKLAVGFAVAGERGLGLFGGDYDGALGNVVRSNNSGGGNQGGGGNGNSGELEFSLLDPSWVATFGLQVIMHLGVLLVLTGVPLWILIAGSRKLLTRAPEEQTENYSQKFVFLVGTIVLTMIFVSSLFASVSLAWGETLQGRVMIRYYEFAFVLLPILALLPASRQWVGKLANWLVPVASLAIGVVGTSLMLSLAPSFYTDSALLAAIRGAEWVYWLLLPASVAMIIYWQRRNVAGARGWLLGFWSFVVLVYLVTSFNNLSVPGSAKGLYTNSSFWIKENLTEQQIDGLVIIGNDLRLLQSSQFWLRDPSVTSRVVAPGEPIDLKELPRDKYFAFIGNIGITGKGEVVHQTDRFVVIKTPAAKQ